jgi:uncharacterized membrane protein HdeD (DUF308 family)
MLRIFYFLLSTLSGALISIILVWGFIVLAFPSMNIDTASNILFIFFLIGGVGGFLFYFRKSHKNNWQAKS